MNRQSQDPKGFRNLWSLKKSVHLRSFGAYVSGGGARVANLKLDRLFVGLYSRPECISFIDNVEGRIESDKLITNLRRAKVKQVCSGALPRPLS